MSKKGLTPKWFFILVVTATLLYYEQLFPRASVWISDAMQHSQKGFEFMQTNFIS